MVLAKISHPFMKKVQHFPCAGKVLTARNVQFYDIKGGKIWEIKLCMRFVMN